MAERALVTRESPQAKKYFNRDAEGWCTRSAIGKGLQAVPLPHQLQRTAEGRALEAPTVRTARLSISSVTSGGPLQSSSSVMSRFGGTVEERHQSGEMLPLTWGSSELLTSCCHSWVPRGRKGGCHSSQGCRDLQVGLLSRGMQEDGGRRGENQVLTSSPLHPVPSGTRIHMALCSWEC